MSVPRQRGADNPWLILGVLTLGLFMALLDLTIVNISLPDIITDLEATLDEALWVFSAYTLAFATLLVVGGRLGDYYGPRRVYLVGLVIFVVASALCGFADDPLILISARAVQGLGAALVAPQLLAVTAAVFPPSKWGAAFGLSAAVSGLAVLLGPTLGGVIVNYLSWRWVFYVNVPVGILTLLLVLRFVPDLRPGRKQAFGLGSAALLIAGLGIFSLALIEGERWDWQPFVWGLLVVGVAFLVAFAVLQFRSQETGALVPLSLFRSRNFSAMCAVIGVIGFAMLATFLPLTIYLQTILQMSPLKAGLTIAVMPLASAIVSGISGQLADRYGGKPFLLSGLLLFGVGVVYLALVTDPSTGTGELIAPLILMGTGTGLVFAPLFAVAFTELDPQMSGAASGVINTTQELGALLATALVGAVLQAQLVGNMRSWVDEQAARIPPEGQEAFRAGFEPLTDGSVGITTSGPAQLPSGVDPTQAQQTIAAFNDAFVSAMQVSYVLPAVALLVGMVVVAFSRPRPRPTPPVPGAPTASPPTTAGQR